ncbi:sugar ABC transporter substrate-binding protein [Litorivicinus lipolyticus]|uniref:Sugar ABC transporter substrate-binding protein n=1 Tax=Litorivicinus lipolyticus TaxID=418701 RepID=A0A5Q2QE25_9GAMM|nr:polysaccharide biosynthesis/export family protein [Litorivicinus lipolyticus]QGG80110.1 sugar ABC transporter substrate-binding protein [Litorivicinus lipolyticus]
MEFRKLSPVAVALASLTLVGCASTYNADSLAVYSDETRTEMATPFEVGAGDVIEVRVWRSPELSVSGPVRSDGMFALPLIGSIQVAGRTPEDVKTEIETKLTEFVASPEVTVIVANTSSDEFTNRVRVTGAVGSPLSLSWRKDMTVLDLVLLAGGANDFAAPQKTVLYRKTENGVTAYPVYLDDILYGGKLATNYNLMPSDILTVPESSF